MTRITLCLLLITCVAGGQDLPREEIDPTRIADQLYATQEEDLNYEALYENVMHILAHPIDLNKATDEELNFLHVLSPSQVRNLLAYRKENKSFLSIYELQAVPEFDPEIIMKLAPFVRIPDPAASLDASLLTRIVSESDNFFILRMGRSLSVEAASAGKNKGSPDKLLLRFRSSRAGDFSFGFACEKDAGEALNWSIKDKYYGLDFWSQHAQLQNKGRLKNLIVGDYQAQFGQGLMIGGIFGTGKGSETITAIRRSNIGLLPYTSVQEAGYLRGIAATLGLGHHCNGTIFYSRCRRDASVAGDSTELFAGSLQLTGLHRTDSEMENRKKVIDMNFGSVIQYKNKGIDAGIMFNRYQTDVPIIPSPKPYNQFAFSGSHNNNVGMFINYDWNNLSFFSEVAKSLNAGSALVAGVLCTVTASLDLSILYRFFARDFYTRYSNALSENSTPQNERGIYWGWRYRFNRRFTLTGYFDMFQFPWVRYRAYAPSEGYEWLLRFTYQPSRNVMIWIQAREETKDRNDGSAIDRVYQTSRGRKNNYWVHCEIGLNEKLRMKSRVQFSCYSFGEVRHNGFVLSEDIIGEIGKLEITGRYALFNTDDYDNRQYVYENDVLLAYSMPAYYGIGVRKMLMLRYKLNRYLSIWVRYAATRYLQQEKYSFLDGDSFRSLENDVKFQLRFQL